MKTVRNISEKKIALVDYGEVEANGTMEVADDFHNANFEDVLETKSSRKPAKEEDITNTIK